MDIKDPVLAQKVEAWIAEHKRTVTVERRVIHLDAPELQMRANFDDPKKPRLTGYAAVFNKRTELWEGFWEQVAPGAFADSLRSEDVYALWNHDPRMVLGRTGAGNLTLSEDERGLRYDISPIPDTDTAREVTTLVKLGIVRKSSFGFSIKEFRQEKIGKDGVLMTIVKADPLFDVSPVTYPAYRDTEAHVRMIAGEFERAYVFDDGREPIIVSAEAEKPTPPQISDEDLFSQIDEARKRLT